MIRSADLRAATGELQGAPVAIAPDHLPGIISGSWRSVQGRVPNRSGSIAVVPLIGLLFPRSTFAQRYFGGVALDSWAHSIRNLMGRTGVGTIVIDVDSPGGSVYGVEEAANVVREAARKMRVIAVADQLMASGAYWIASQASEVVASPSGELGSVGVYTIHFDWSEAFEAEGIKPTIIQAGEFKAEGNPYEPLSDGARDHTQALVNDYHTLFTRSVARGREVGTRFVQERFGKGRTFTAQRAVSAGMADRVATLDQVLQELLSEKGSSPKSQASSRPTYTWADVLGMAADEDMRVFRRTAFHEAAHAIVSHIVGNGISGVFLRPEIEGGRVVRIGGGFIQRIIPGKPSPAASAAGFVGEQLGGYRPDLSVSESDWAGVEEAQISLGTVLHRGRALEQARACLSYRTHQLWAMAEALLERGQLSGPEATRIAEREEPGHEPPPEGNVAGTLWDTFGRAA